MLLQKLKILRAFSGCRTTCKSEKLKEDFEMKILPSKNISQLS